MTLTFDIHKDSCTNLVDCIYQLLYVTSYNSVCKIHIVLPSSHIKAQGTEFDIAVTYGHHLNKLGST